MTVTTLAQDDAQIEVIVMASKFVAPVFCSECGMIHKMKPLNKEEGEKPDDGLRDSSG